MDKSWHFIFALSYSFVLFFPNPLLVMCLGTLSSSTTEKLATDGKKNKEKNLRN